ncbi:hypothetical protein ACIP1G_02295 [Pseudomonas sp. NPDC089392]|uniref:hypothetical protein n=1 Tax=Pseudomonas sp. NPDC089392 TaxID=3364459 RepID=UPI0037F40C07
MPLRFVNIGAIAGATLPMNPEVLRSTGLEMTGSGLGSIATEELVKVVGRLLEAVRPGNMKVEANAIPLKQAEAAWLTHSSSRIVFVL